MKQNTDDFFTEERTQPLVTPEDLEAEELAAYAEEYGAIEDFADVDLDALSDIDEVEEPSISHSTHHRHDDMDLS